MQKKYTWTVSSSLLRLKDISSGLVLVQSYLISSLKIAMLFIDCTEMRGNASIPEDRVQIQIISTNSGNSLKQAGEHLRGKNVLGNISKSTNRRQRTCKN